jgi:hypothetical protein
MADNKKTLVEFMYGPSARASAQNNVSSKSALPTSNISAQQSIESIGVKNIPKFMTPLNFLPGRGMPSSPAPVDNTSPLLKTAVSLLGGVGGYLGKSFTNFLNSTSLDDLDEKDKENKLKEAFLSNMGSGLDTSKKSSAPIIEKTADQKYKDLYDFVKDPIEYKPVFVRTEGIMPIIKFEKIDNSKINNENTNTFLKNLGATMEYDDMGAPSLNFVDIPEDQRDTTQQQLEVIRNKKIKGLDGELNAKRDKEFEELNSRYKYDGEYDENTGNTITVNAPLGALASEAIEITSKYDKLKKEGYKKIRSQFEEVVDNFINPQMFKKLPVIDSKSAIGLSMDNLKNDIETSAANSMAAVSNLNKVIEDFSLTGTKTVDLDGKKYTVPNKVEMYDKLMKNGIKSAHVYDQHNKNVAIENADFGEYYGKVYGGNSNLLGRALEGLGFKDVDRTTGMSQIEKDEYASIGLRDQISIMSSYAKSLSNGKDGALDQLNAIDTTNIKPEQLKQFIAYKNSVKANYDKIEQLKNTMLAWGEENLKSYNKELATQKLLTEQGDLNPVGANMFTVAKYITGIPDVIGDMAQKIKYRGKDYQEEVKISSGSKQTVSIEELLEAQVNTRRMSDLKPQVIDFKTKQITDLSEAEATRLFGEDGKFVGFSNIVSVRPFFYQASKTAIDTAILGGIGGAIEATVSRTALKFGGEKILQFGAQQAIKAELSQATRLAGDKLIFGNLTGKEVMWKALDGTINLSTSGLKVANKLGAMVIPTGLLFGNEMYDGYRAKGFTPEQAMNLTKIGIFIEGGTEAIFGNEVKLFNAFIGKEATLVEKKLANEVFERAIGSKFMKQTGRAATAVEMSLFKKLYINAKKFANSKVGIYTVEGLKMGGEEGSEEVIGNLGTALFIEPLAKKYDPTFEGQGFEIKDQLNTMLTTMATMLPMMGKAGSIHIQNEKLEALSSKYEVGSNPGYHLNTLAGMFKNGDINQEQYQKAVNYVSDYENFHNVADHVVNNSEVFKEYNIKEKENAKIQIFKKQLQKSDIENRLLNAVTDRQKAVFAEQLSKIDNELTNYIDSGEYTSKEQRVAANIFQLDYLYNKDTLKHYNSGKIIDIVKILTEQQSKETDEKLKDVYQKKIDLLSNKLKNDIVEYHTNKMQKEELETSLKDLTENNPDQVKELEDLRLINKDREVEKWKKENPNAKEKDLLAQVKVIAAKYKMETDLPLIEAYQKAKKDKSNPELVQAFEKAFNIAPEVVEVEEVEVEEEPAKKGETPKEKASTAKEKETTKGKVSKPNNFREALKYMESHPEEFTEVQLQMYSSKDFTNIKEQQNVLKEAQEHYNKTYGEKEKSVDLKQDYINRISATKTIEELEDLKKEMLEDPRTEEFQDELYKMNIRNRMKDIKNKENSIIFGGKEYTVGSFVTIRGEGNKLYQIKGLNDDGRLRLEFLGKGATINLSDPKDIMTTLSEEKGLEEISKMAKEKAKEKAAEAKETTTKTEEDTTQTEEEMKEEKKESEDTLKMSTENLEELLDNETFMNESVDKGNSKSLEELMEELKKSNKDKC